MKLNFALWTNVDDLQTLWITATVLATGKGWVLAVLAMLTPEAGRCAWLRAAPVPAPRAAPPLPSAARRSHRRVLGQRASRHIDAKRACRPGVEQRAEEGKKPGGGRSPVAPGCSMARKRARMAVQRPRRAFHCPDTGQQADSPQSRPKPRGGSISRSDRSRSHTARSASAVGVSARPSGSVSSHCW